MKRLIKDNSSFLPGFLFVTPVAVFAGKWKLLSADLCIAQQVDWVSEAADFLFQILFD
ncbi:MAG: hypothetical protein N2B02_09595 [Amylibacter sp.]